MFNEYSFLNAKSLNTHSKCARQSRIVIEISKCAPQSGIVIENFKCAPQTGIVIENSR